MIPITNGSDNSDNELLFHSFIDQLIIIGDINRLLIHKLNILPHVDVD